MVILTLRTLPPMEGKHLHLAFWKAIAPNFKILSSYDFKLKSLEDKIDREIQKSLLKQASNPNFNNEMCEQ